jgi:glycosyltransferase involved in cell wall biosynthesis
MSIKTNPLTFLIPVKNGYNYLNNFRKIIESNANPHDEIVIIDDGSNDGSNEFLKAWSKSQNNIKLIVTSGIGIVESLNLGIKHSTNQWIARFDVDDDYEPNRINLQKNSITNSTAAIFTDYDFIDNDNNSYGYLTSPIFPDATAISLVNSSRTAHPSAMFDKEAVLEAGGYLLEDFPAEDLSLWIRLSKIGKIISVPELLLHYRIRKGSITLNQRNESIAKKLELVSKAYHLHNNYQYCLENFEEIMEQYKFLPNSNQRKLLFLRDMLTANTLLLNDSSKNFSLLKKSFKSLNLHLTIIELLELNKDKNRRANLRNSFK